MKSVIRAHIVLLLTGIFFIGNMHAQSNIVLDILEGSSSGVPAGTEYAVGPSYLVFTPQSMTIGVELWSSDGTEEGTALVRDIWEGSGQSFPSYPTFLNGTAFFVAEDAEHGTELWKSDGSTDGTVLVKDINPGPESGAEVFFNVREIFASESLGLVFFGASDNVSTSPELWKSDGTENGTALVKELVPGVGGSSPDYFAELNGIVFFSGEAGSSGTELCRTDGTTDGTYLVKDIWPGSTGSDVRYLTVAGEKVYFSARTQAHGYELWVSDGTTDGTQLVSDIRAGSSGALDPGGLQVLALMPLGDKLVFTATQDFVKASLWVTDGTEAGTEMLYEFPGENFFQAEILDWTELNDKLYFLVDELSNDEGLWVTDGTVAGTFKTANFNFFTNPVDAQITTVKDHLVISADHDVAGEAVYKSDGTDAGTERIAQATQAIFFGTTSDDKLFFSAQNSLGRELWIYEPDSTSAVRLISDIDVIVYPNPVTTHFTIEGPETGSIDQVELMDIHGRVLRQWKQSVGYQIDLPAGYYQLLIHTKGEWYSQPLIISDTR